MIKKLLALAILALACGWLSAQTTAVSAVVIDTDGTTWFGGTWKIEFVPNSQNPNISVYNINGTPLSNSVLFQNGQLDNSGNLSFSIYQSTVISPANSSWKLTVCPQAVTQCGVYNFATSTSTLDLSSVLTTVIPAPRFHGVANTYGYNDGEAVLQLQAGNQYYDVTNLCLKVYNGATWGCVGSVTTSVTMTGDDNGPSNANIVSGINGVHIPSNSAGFLLFGGGAFTWHPLVAADIDALGNITNNTSGNAATATAAHTAPTGCPAGETPNTIDINWNFTNCLIAGGSGINGAVYTTGWTIVAGQEAQANCASSCTATLPGSISTGFSGTIVNIGAGTLTIATGGPTYDGVTTLPPGYNIGVWTDGTNYHSSLPSIQTTPQRVIAGEGGQPTYPLTISATTETTLLSETVTFPAIPGTYRVSVSYNAWVTSGANECAAEILDSTNSHAYASSGQNSNGTGYIGLANSEISSSTYAAGTTALFKLQVICNNGAGGLVGATTQANGGAVFSFATPEPTYLSVTPIHSL